ncbi:MAG: VWA domain-containing protein [Terracidiphilus sp.]
MLPALAQTPETTDAATQETTRGDQSYYQLSVDVPLVNLDVLVTDEDGKVLSGLKEGNFRVLDNGVPQKIESFSPTASPITVVVLLEYSALSYGYYADKAADWANDFLNHIEPQDWVALVTYDMRSRVRVDFTHQLYRVRDVLYTLWPPQFSEADLYDALMDTLDKLEPVKGRKSILLLSTGNNSFSSSTLDEVLARLRATDTVIFSIGLAEAEYVRYGGTNIDYLQGKNVLNTFAKQTGGLALFPRFEGELPSIFRSVVGFLRSEYTLTFRPPKESRDGRYHKLKVEIVGPDGKPLQVTDEKGKRHKVEVFARQGYVAPRERVP